MAKKTVKSKSLGRPDLEATVRITRALRRDLITLGNDVGVIVDTVTALRRRVAVLENQAGIAPNEDEG